MSSRGKTPKLPNQKQRAKSVKKQPALKPGVYTGKRLSTKQIGNRIIEKVKLDETGEELTIAHEWHNPEEEPYNSGIDPHYGHYDEYGNDIVCGSSNEESN